MTLADDDRLHTVLRDALSGILQREIPVLEDHMRLFDELGLDSTGVIDLLMALEDSIGLQIEPDELTPEVFESVGSLIGYVRAGLAADAPVG